MISRGVVTFMKGTIQIRPLTGLVFVTRRTSTNSTKRFHKTSINKYPDAKRLPLPHNLENIVHSETARWSPNRIRDMNGAGIVGALSQTINGKSIESSNQTNDSRAECFDCTGAVSLTSTMQTNVPEPYKSTNKTSFLNMPGGSWESGNKFIAENMCEVHYANAHGLAGVSAGSKPDSGSDQGAGVIANKSDNDNSGNSNPGNSSSEKLTTRQKLQSAVKDYGSTVLVFHVAISLASLGICYTVVSAGLDVPALITKIGIDLNNELAAKLASGTGTFVAAYALHKCFIPARMGLTLFCTPFIVRYLRKVGFLKVPAPK